MPIYAYKCDACGHAKDVLQKISDPVLTDCPACGAAAFTKQVTAAGFQLKGSGWYVTDFRGGNNAAKSETASASPGSTSEAASGGDAATSTADTSSASSSPSASASISTSSATTATPAKPAAST